MMMGDWVRLRGLLAPLHLQVMILLLLLLLLRRRRHRPRRSRAVGRKYPSAPPRGIRRQNQMSAHARSE